MINTFVVMEKITCILSVLTFLPQLASQFNLNGPMKGAIHYSKLGRPYFSFRRIPFTQQSIEKVRAKETQPSQNKSRIWYATKKDLNCINKTHQFANSKEEDQEDYLYLNIYVPKVKSGELLPVMVTFPLEEFSYKRGANDYIDTEYLMDKNVILITFNCRQLKTGFKTILESKVSGSYDLKNRRAALQWINNNIKFFGGNKNQIIIFGQSTGGVSVYFHTIVCLIFLRLLRSW